MPHPDFPEYHAGKSGRCHYHRLYRYGRIELRRTLTGFKYIGEQIGRLEAEGGKERYIFGFEESYGYLSGAHVRDKDAVNAVMLACECAAWYASQGMTLLDAVNALYEKFGFYRSGLISIAFEGQNGMKAMEGLIASLRADTPKAVSGRAVTQLVDYLSGAGGLIPSDVLELRLAGEAKLIVRPSGTEPKLKLYLSVKESSEVEALQALDQLNAAANSLVKERSAG